MAGPDSSLNERQRDRWRDPEKPGVATTALTPDKPEPPTMRSWLLDAPPAAPSPQSAARNVCRADLTMPPWI